MSACQHVQHGLTMRSELHRRSDCSKLHSQDTAKKAHRTSKVQSNVMSGLSLSRLTLMLGTVAPVLSRSGRQCRRSCSFGFVRPNPVQGHRAQWGRSRPQSSRRGLTVALERVRFAPSPTGSLHVGGARTALYNYLVARREGGTFILRVEDTDTARSTRESEQSMMRDLTFLGLDWDEGPDKPGTVGPYRQSERLTIYQNMAKQLLESGQAYPCFSTEEELEEKREKAEAEGRPPQYDGTWRDADPAEVKRRINAGEPYAVRFKVEPEQRVEIEDIVRGSVAWDADATVGDFILLRSNGIPVYNFCVAIDDALMGITTVIRAEEHLTNTLRQCLVLDALGYPRPKYAHVSLILGEDRSKLSKRHGASSVDQFRDEGFIPAALNNYLALLGWNDGTEDEIFTRQDLIDRFSLGRLVKSASVFDKPKLKWLNGQHLRTMPDEQLLPMMVKRLEQDGIAKPGATDFVAQALNVAKESMDLLSDATQIIDEALQYPLKHTIESGEAAELLEQGLWEMAQVVVCAYESGEMPQGGEEDFMAKWKAWIKATSKATKRKGKALFHPIRLALTGKMSGADVGEQLRLIHLAQQGATHVVPLEARIAEVKAVLQNQPLKEKAAAAAS